MAAVKRHSVLHVGEVHIFGSIVILKLIPEYMKTNFRVTDEDLLIKTSSLTLKTSHVSCLQDCEYVQCSQRTFLLEYISFTQKRTTWLMNESKHFVTGRKSGFKVVLFLCKYKKDIVIIKLINVFQKYFRKKLFFRLSACRECFLIPFFDCSFVASSASVSPFGVLGSFMRTDF